MLSYFDICVNIDSPQFKDDADEVIQAAHKNGVHHMTLTGSSVSSTKTAIRMAQRHEGCVATCGIHPHDAHSYSEATRQELKELASDPKVRAIGECGLDYNRMYSTKTEQIDCFTAQLALAHELNLPVFLHERDAHDDFLQLIRQHPGKGVIHCFTGSARQVEAYLDCGLWVGITGWICDDRRNQDLLEAIQHIPLERLMIETDAPWLTPRTLRPRPKKNRNTPALLPHIARVIADKMNCSIEDVVNYSTQNAHAFFGTSPLR